MTEATNKTMNTKNYENENENSSHENPSQNEQDKNNNNNGDNNDKWKGKYIDNNKVNKNKNIYSEKNIMIEETEVDSCNSENDSSNKSISNVYIKENTDRSTTIRKG